MPFLPFGLKKMLIVIFNILTVSVNPVPSRKLWWAKHIFMILFDSFQILGGSGFVQVPGFWEKLVRLEVVGAKTWRLWKGFPWKGFHSVRNDRYIPIRLHQWMTAVSMLYEESFITTTGIEDYKVGSVLSYSCWNFEEWRVACEGLSACLVNASTSAIIRNDLLTNKHWEKKTENEVA